MKDIREIANKVVELEVKINKRQEEMRLNGIELKKEDDEVKADKKKKIKKKMMKLLKLVIKINMKEMVNLEGELVKVKNVENLKKNKFIIF